MAAVMPSPGGGFGSPHSVGMGLPSVSSPAAVGSMASDTTNSPAASGFRRTSNTEQDAIHQRAMLVLNIASSIETSNVRRRRHLQRIESGRTDHVQQAIEDIMQEKPVDLMTLILKETEPEALPTSQEIEEKYHHYDSTDDEEEDDENVDDNEEGEGNVEDDEKAEQEGNEKINNKKGSSGDTSDMAIRPANSFDQKQDAIVKESQKQAIVPDPALLKLDSESVKAYTEPLQEQLKRSYAAIIQLRENADLRYQALEKKYMDLRRSQQHPGAPATGVEKSADVPMASQTPPPAVMPPNEALNTAYQALIRLQENSELRYGILESKYLDLKRSHAETEARNGRLEADVQYLQQQLFEASKHDTNDGPSFVFGTPLRGSHTHGNNNNNRSVKTMNIAKLRELLVAFEDLCEQVFDCGACQKHLPESVLLLTLRQQIAKFDTTADDAASIGLDDDKDDSDDDDDANGGDDDNEKDEGVSMNESFARHEGAMALLGASWDKINQIDGKQKKKKKLAAGAGGGKFASLNLSESKKEKQLRGKKSQFVSAQSGVYCLINHDMQNQYDVDKVKAPPVLSPTKASSSRDEHTPTRKKKGKGSSSSPKSSKLLNVASKKDTKNDSSESPGSDMSPAPPPQVNRTASPVVCTGDTQSRDREHTSRLLEPILSASDNEDAVAVSDDIQLASKVSTRPGGSPVPVVHAKEEEEEDVPITPFGNLRLDMDAPPRRQPSDKAVAKASTTNDGTEMSVRSQSSAKSALKKKSQSRKISANAEEERESVTVSFSKNLTTMKLFGETSDEKQGNVNVNGSIQLIQGGGADMDASGLSLDASMTSLVGAAFPSMDESGRCMDVSENLDASGYSADLASIGSRGGRPRRIPPAQLDAAERNARRQQALKEAKASARNVKAENKRREKAKKAKCDSHSESSSVVSALSATSGLSNNINNEAVKKKRSSLLKNPFKRKNKTLQSATASGTAHNNIPAVIQEKATSRNSTTATSHLKSKKQAYKPPQIHSRRDSLVEC